jgi:hypothetical protein
VKYEKTEKKRKKTEKDRKTNLEKKMIELHGK